MTPHQAAGRHCMLLRAIVKACEMETMASQRGIAGSVAAFENIVGAA